MLPQTQDGILETSLSFVTSMKTVSKIRLSKYNSQQLSGRNMTNEACLVVNNNPQNYN